MCQLPDSPRGLVSWLRAGLLFVPTLGSSPSRADRLGKWVDGFCKKVKRIKNERTPSIPLPFFTCASSSHRPSPPTPPTYLQRSIPQSGQAMSHTAGTTAATQLCGTAGGRRRSVSLSAEKEQAPPSPSLFLPPNHHNLPYTAQAGNSTCTYLLTPR